MIIPTAEFDPLFADDGVPFQAKMIQYIRREFGDVLGPEAALLKVPGGLDHLAETRNGHATQSARRKSAA